jgi:hypothetical protein
MSRYIEDQKNLIPEKTEENQGGSIIYFYDDMKDKPSGSGRRVFFVEEYKGSVDSIVKRKKIERTDPKRTIHLILPNKK